MIYLLLEDIYNSLQLPCYLECIFELKSEIIMHSKNIFINPVVWNLNFHLQIKNNNKHK
jgi:hypothetical protein